MRIKVNQYDTIRDAKGQRYRITEISESLGACKARKVGIDGQVVSKGRERTIMLEDIDGRKYQRVNLAPVLVTKQEPRPDLVCKPQEPKKASVEELFIKDEKAPQIEKDEPSKDEAEKSIEGGREKNKPKAHTLEDTFEEFREKNQPNVKNVTVTVDGREIREQITHEKELDVLKAELKEKLQECIEHKKTISKMHDALEEAREARAVLEQNAQDSNDKIGFLEERNGELEDVNRRFSQDNARLLAENLELKKKLKDANMAKGAAVYITQDELEILIDYLDLAFEEPEDKNHAKMHVIAALDVILTLARGRMKP